jgi:Ala-tRNA(Pro) deacylase
MTIATKLNQHLKQAGVEFDVIAHPRTASSSRTAQAAHVTGECLAKAVVLHDASGYLLAVVPSTHRVEVDSLNRLLGRTLNLATEDEIGDLFDDCEVGAVPPIGAPYGIETVLDESLAAPPDICFEAGDHRNLIRVTADNFTILTADASRERFSHHA